MEVAPFILLLLVALFALMVVGFVLYLSLSGALHSVHLRPFRFALYILLLITAMTGGITLIQHSFEACATTVADQEFPLHNSLIDNCN
ncbi:MAG TPA: hypothetical protein VJU02_07455 [Nitrospiraceae bacterium]|nr:hypothetical protein [Nitrospiraceae bacterium]